MGSSTLHSSKPDAGNGNSIREYFTKWIDGIERLLEERDRRYEDRFHAQETAVSAAFSAQKELNRVVQDSAKEAVTKAEVAQESYNKRSNEFRAALDDQNKLMSSTMLSRNEYNSNHKALIEKIDAQGVKYDDKINEIGKQIDFLRGEWSKQVGRGDQRTESSAGSRWAIGVTIGVVTTIILLLVNIVMFVVNFVK